MKLILALCLVVAVSAIRLQHSDPARPDGQINPDDSNKAYNKIDIPKTTSDDPKAIKEGEKEVATAETQRETINDEAKKRCNGETCKQGSEAGLIEVQSAQTDPARPDGQIDPNDSNKAYNRIDIPKTTSDDPKVIKEGIQVGATAETQRETINDEAKKRCNGDTCNEGTGAGSLIEVESSSAEAAASGPRPAGQVDPTDSNKAYNKIDIAPSTSADPKVLSEAKKVGHDADTTVEQVVENSAKLCKGDTCNVAN